MLVLLVAQWLTWWLSVAWGLLQYESVFEEIETHCDDFYAPYVTISLGRKGPLIASAHSTTVIDLQDKYGLLCINGPAFIYYTNISSEGLLENPEFKIYSHTCFTFNRRNWDCYQKNNRYPPTGDCTTVHDNRILAVRLLSDPEDYRRSAFATFPRSEFRIPANPLSAINEGTVGVEGSSFGMVINAEGKMLDEELQDPSTAYSVFCFNVTHAPAVVGTVSGRVVSGMLPKFCIRDEEDPTTEFDKVFHRSLREKDYNWRGCGVDGAGGGPPTEPPGKLPDFRTVDLANTVNNSPGKVFKSTGNSNPFYTIKLPGVSPKPIDNDDGFVEIPSVAATATDCEDVPTIPLSCSDDIDPECKILKRVLQLEETDWTTTELKNAAWRQAVFERTVQIYQKVCPQVSKALAPALVRIIYFFIELVAKDSNTKEPPQPPTVPQPPGEKKWSALNDATLDPGQNPVNKALWDLLETCQNNVEKLPLYRTKDVRNNKNKKEVEVELDMLARNSSTPKRSSAELEKIIRDIYVWFPYHIWLPGPKGWGNGTQIRIGRVVEAAEADFMLDWAIDTFWKVVSTVLGYCHQHFDSATADRKENFMNLLTRYKLDVFDVIQEQWLQYTENPQADSYIFGNYEQVYNILFGEFIYGVASRYIDACNEASYWWSSVPTTRPVRPVLLRRGEQCKYDTSVTPPVINDNRKPCLHEPPDGTFPNFEVENPLFESYNVLFFG